jgi:hypothetical protein
MCGYVILLDEEDEAAKKAEEKRQVKIMQGDVKNVTRDVHNLIIKPPSHHVDFLPMVTSPNDRLAAQANNDQNQSRQKFENKKQQQKQHRQLSQNKQQSQQVEQRPNKHNEVIDFFDEIDLNANSSGVAPHSQKGFRGHRISHSPPPEPPAPPEINSKRRPQSASYIREYGLLKTEFTTGVAANANSRLVDVNVDDGVLQQQQQQRPRPRTAGSSLHRENVIASLSLQRELQKAHENSRQVQHNHNHQNQNQNDVVFIEELNAKQLKKEIRGVPYVVHDTLRGCKIVDPYSKQISTPSTKNNMMKQKTNNKNNHNTLSPSYYNRSRTKQDKEAVDCAPAAQPHGLKIGGIASSGDGTPTWRRRGDDSSAEGDDDIELEGDDAPLQQQDNSHDINGKVSNNNNNNNESENRSREGKSVLSEESVFTAIPLTSAQETIMRSHGWENSEDKKSNERRMMREEIDDSALLKAAAAAAADDDDDDDDDKLQRRRKREKSMKNKSRPKSGGGSGGGWSSKDFNTKQLEHHLHHLYHDKISSAAPKRSNIQMNVVEEAKENALNALAYFEKKQKELKRLDELNNTIVNNQLYLNKNKNNLMCANHHEKLVAAAVNLKPADDGNIQEGLVKGEVSKLFNSQNRVVEMMHDHHHEVEMKQRSDGSDLLNDLTIFQPAEREEKGENRLRARDAYKRGEPLTNRMIKGLPMSIQNHHHHQYHGQDHMQDDQPNAFVVDVDVETIEDHNHHHNEDYDHGDGKVRRGAAAEKVQLFQLLAEADRSQYDIMLNRPKSSSRRRGGGKTSSQLLKSNSSSSFTFRGSSEPYLEYLRSQK